MTEKKHFDILIVGAGAASASAARLLCQKSLSVGVLEARDRVGGRVYSESYHDINLEMGAEFIHCQTPNFKSILEQQGILIKPRERDLKQFKANQQIVSFAPSMSSLLSSIYDKVKMTSPSMTVAQALEQLPALDFSQQDICLAIAMIEAYYAVDIEQASYQFILEDAVDEVNHQTIDCYHHFIKDIFESQGDSLSVQLNTKIEAIYWSNNKVTVRCAQGQLYHASKVLLTVPVSILNQTQNTAGISFEPPLPEAKQRAMEPFSMGQVERLNLVFADKPIAASFSELYGESLNYNFWLHKEMNGQSVLTAWAGGKASEKLTRKSKEEKIEMALSDLSLVSGCSIEHLSKKLLKIAYHDWNQDPFSKGAYSYLKPYDVDDIKALATPLDKTLYFAGEATAPVKYLGTVHGAVESGVRAAQEIMADLLHER